MTQHSKHLYEFGPYRIDPAKRVLLRGEESVQLPSKVFETLLVLVQHSEEVVSKDDLLKSVWPDSFVEESNLSQSIFLLRKALGETAQDHRYIVTIPGRGYRFAERVTEVSEGSDDLIVRTRSIQTVTTATEEKRLQAWRPFVWVGLAVLLVVGVLGYRHYQVLQTHPASTGSTVPAPTPSAPIRARRSVAVLGFKNVSGRTDEAWLSTALSEMLTTELAAGEQLSTVPGESVVQMKMDLSLPEADSYGPDTLAKIHRNLNADDIVVGSYIALGKSEIRLDLRLQDAVRGEMLAAVSEKGSKAHIDDLVSRAGLVLREKLGAGPVSGSEAAAVKATLPSNPESARLYSEGLARLRTFDVLGARDLLEMARAVEPNYPLVYSALAEVWQRLGYDEKAKAAAKKALDLSANLSREDRLSVEARYWETAHEREKAAELYRTLFNLFPDNLDYGLRVASAQERSGNGKGALATVAELRKMPAPARDDPRIDLAEDDASYSLGEFKLGQAAASRAEQKAEMVNRINTGDGVKASFGKWQRPGSIGREKRDRSIAAQGGQAIANLAATEQSIEKSTGVSALGIAPSPHGRVIPILQPLVIVLHLYAVIGLEDGLPGSRRNGGRFIGDGDEGKTDGKKYSDPHDGRQPTLRGGIRIPA